MTRLLSLALLPVYLSLFVAALPSANEQIPLAPADPHTSNSWEWSDCGAASDVVEIKSLSLSPDPPKPGVNLTVTASGYVSSTIEDGAWADVSVKLGLIKLLTKSFDVCEEAKKANVSIQCPVSPGEYTVVQTVALPKEIPPAKFSVEVRAYNADEAAMLCANIKIDFLPKLSGIFGR
ncbi:hypothetical protein K439DRAFT_615359 [Ramaria rubella]|nr:hypothetical protein K439DRAFT_615359 [Ramaria rubella]